MRILRLPLLVLFFCTAASPAFAQPFFPIASGALGDVTTRDGDSAFDVQYFAAPDFAGEPVMTRFEARVAPGDSAIAGSIPAGGRGSVRWSATVTPKRSGVFMFSLRATGAAVLKIDGAPVVGHPAAAALESRSTGSARLLAGRPYEFVVEFPDTDSQGQIALEWAPPSAVQPDDSPAAPAQSSAEITAGPRAGERVGEPARLENAACTIDSRADGTLVITQKSTGASAEFAPEFLVVFQPRGRETKLDRHGGKYLDDGPVGNTSYRVAAWEKETDYLAAARPRARLRASRVTREGGELRWEFPAQPGYTLSASVSAPADGTEPALVFRLDAAASGQFSVGYAGAPAASIAKADWVWQPLVWQEKRFPNRSYLTLEFQCPIGFAMTGIGGDTIAVGADARELPFRMPVADDSRFGVLVRNAAGLAQPMLFAPVLGGAGSRVEAGASYSFMLRLVARRGAWFENYKHLATSLYGFRDERENVLCSLNTTLENLADFVLNDRFCYWYPKYKTWGYQNDAGPDTGRQQSAADAISLALVLDRAEMLQRRAVPTLEYLLSRKTSQAKFTDPKLMGSAFRYPVDLVAAWRLTGGRATPVREKLLPVLAGKTPAVPPASSWSLNVRALRDHLAAWRLTGDKAFLDAARSAADHYITARIDRAAATFRGSPSSFWPDIAPAYDYLYELHTATGDARYLRAAAAAMRGMTAFAYLSPVPDADFTANPGGVYNKQPVPEETVPAWVVSANGLAAECAATSHSHRGIFMSVYFAGYMTRLGFDSGESFFTDIARSAVVGRYANYPSYAYRNGYTTLHQKPDFPLRPFEEIKKFTSAHYNHPLPMAAFLVDYIVADTYARSAGQIDFPSEYTYSGAYFRNRTYGARPGKFLGDDGVFLWMPKRLVSVNSIQLNHLSARGNGKLYLAFSNQSARPVSAVFTVNPERAAVAGPRRARVWRFPDHAAAPTVAANSASAIPLAVADGRAAIEVLPKGLTCVVIDDVAARTEIQDAMLDPQAPPLPAGATVTAKTPFGPATATALRFGRGLTSVHVWLEAAPPVVGKAVLRYQSDNGKPAQLECGEFPFEFTVPVSDTAKDFRCTIEAATPAGLKTSSELKIRLR